MDPVPAERLRPGIGGIEREHCEVTWISGTAVAMMMWASNIQSRVKI